MDIKNDIDIITNSDIFKNEGKEILSLFGDCVTGGIDSYSKLISKMSSFAFGFNTMFFMAKLKMYIEGVFEPDDNAKRKLAKKLVNDKEKLEYIHIVLKAIDEVETDSKMSYIINLSLALMNDFIQKEDFYRMIMAIKRLLNQDLIYMAENINQKNLKNNVHVDALLYNGLVYISNIPIDDQPEVYNFTELAKKINKFAFEYDVQNECFHIENNDTKALSENSHSMKGIGTILPEDLDGF